MTSQPIPAGARPKISSRARLQTDKLTGKPVLLYPEGALKLNATGEAIVSLCSGESTLEEIEAALAKRYNTSVEVISPHILDYLNRLRARNLLDLDTSPHAEPKMKDVG